MPVKEKLESLTVEVKTPDGVLYYTICDGDDGAPSKVISTFGKAGTALAAWAFALDITINMLLERNTGINEIIEKLSRISSNKSMKTPEGVEIGSGPEGLVVALLEYKRQKFMKFRDSF